MDTIKQHKILLCLFLLFFIVCSVYNVYSPKLRVLVNDNKKSELISTLRSLNEQEIQECATALRLIKRIDSTQCDELYEVGEIYWMRSTKYSGLTVDVHNGKKLILLDMSLKINNTHNPWDYFKLGLTLCHELHHVIYDSKDPYTESITDGKLLNLVSTNQSIFNLINNWNRKSL